MTPEQHAEWHPIVRNQARRAAARWPGALRYVEIDDLESEAWCRVLRYADRIDAVPPKSRGALVMRHVQGAMLDCLRHEYFAGRGAEPGHHGMRAEDGSYVRRERRVGDVIEQLAVAPEADSRIDLSVHLDALNDAERTVVEAVYWGEERLKYAAKALGVSDGRATQIHKRALRKLQARMRGMH